MIFGEFIQLRMCSIADTIIILDKNGESIIDNDDENLYEFEVLGTHYRNRHLTIVLNY